MILESAQMLATNLHKMELPQYLPLRKDGQPFGVTHQHHPCTTWAFEPLNFNWLRCHMEALIDEYHFRFGVWHHCREALPRLEQAVAHKGLSPTCLSLPTWFQNSSRFKDVEVHLAYARTLEAKWQDDVANGRPPVWTKRSRPVFQ